MPPKAKFNKTIGKLTLHLKRQNENHTAGPELSDDAREQFEVELCWCIQQLQNALKSGKLNAKQVQDYTKSLNALMSNATSMVKKRQVMRLSFGDYRAKMAEENKKYSSGVAKIKIVPTKAKNNKSVFLKKSIFSTLMANNGDFKFNFDVKPLQNGAAKEERQEENQTNSEALVENLSNIKLNETNCNNEQFHFITSDNSFRFNFH